jgi:hypothetical protein
MKKETCRFQYLICLSVLLICLGLMSCQEGLQEDHSDLQVNDSITSDNSSQIIENQYIVVYKEDQLSFRLDPNDYETGHEILRKETSDLLSRYGVEEEQFHQLYSFGFQGFAIKLSEQKKNELLSDSRVKKIIPDRKRFLNVQQGKSPVRVDPAVEIENTQIIPWGVKRVGGPFEYKGTRKVWVIDTGIDINHPDLNVDHRHGFDAYNHRRNWNFDDEHGHGTHVAGTIGALDNHFGVVGVAAGVPVVPIKVFTGSRAEATDSGILAGVEYVGRMARPGDVANLSFGWDDKSDPFPLLEEAVLRISEQRKIWMVIASGNSHLPGNTFTPARVDGRYTITVSATDNADRLAWFSHYGHPIKFGAPGVNVFSTWMAGAYRNSSGTSMSAPHVAGLRIFGSIETDGYVKNYPIEYLDPIAFRSKGFEGMGHIRP